MDILVCIVLFASGVIPGAIGGYIFAERNIGDKLASFATEVHQDILELKSGIRQEVKDLKNDLKK